MTTHQATQTSKFLSLILRHKPETIGLQLDEQSWADVPELLRKLAAHRHPLTPEALAELVRENGKQRFAFSEDGQRIRASQGHSVVIALGLSLHQPPELLYHGTVAAALHQIFQEGLQKMSRQHVHLSKDMAPAAMVGQRRGKPVILTIKSGAIHRDGFLFLLSANGGVADQYRAAAIHPDRRRIGHRVNSIYDCTNHRYRRHSWRIARAGATTRPHRPSSG